MVSITLSVPPEVKKKMDGFPEMNWSGFIREQIIKKTEKLTYRQKLLKQLEKDKEDMDWAVRVVRADRDGTLEKLKKKGLL